MLSHLGLNVPDLDTAVLYYDQVLPQLGYEAFPTSVGMRGYRPLDGRHGPWLFLYPAAVDTPYSADSVGLQHLAFGLATRDEVDAVHRLVLELGSPVLTPPQDWPEYPPPYYAMFWTDPFGLKLEAVCVRP
jgi:catechol 2,3-dioxygenase-like lactoylglutathione lyase family enzyme